VSFIDADTTLTTRTGAPATSASPQPLGEDEAGEIVDRHVHLDAVRADRPPLEMRSGVVRQQVEG
jgi:hypothetical protein